MGYQGIVALALVLLLLVAGFIAFERRKSVVEKTVLIAILSAVSSVGRAFFVMLPSVQPSSFIIIVTGIVFGREAGFMTGALTALLSSLMLGLGPWTVWQMFAWGLMGGLAGVLSKPLAAHVGMRVAYGVIWGFLFGWIMNLWMLMSLADSEMGLAYFISVCAASFIFDGMHAGFNGLLIMLGGGMFIKMFSRIAVKYGLVQAK